MRVPRLFAPQSRCQEDGVFSFRAGEDHRHHASDFVIFTMKHDEVRS